MAMRIYNSLSRKKEEFAPLEPGRVRMYVCGITAYDLCHVGHARAVIVFDVVYRYLRYLGCDVTYVRNFTDIDDKIIARAFEEGLSAKEVAEKYIQEFYRDTDPLGLARPTLEPRATDHVTEMIAAVEALLEKGYAYEVGGDVYYSVEKWPGYGQLSGKSLEALTAGARVDIDEKKNNPLDFALWKKSKPGEPFWDSPWGRGRPGWHIECSVMSQKYLGTALDIHGGGQDLIFPHHENEIAQSSALTGQPFVRFWMHNGFLQVNREKMSKSKGNFFTIRELLEQFHPEVLRLFFLSHHYRSPVEFSLALLEDNKKNLDYFYLLLRRLKERGVEEASPVAETQPEVEEFCQAFAGQFRQAMDDDFNSALALSHFYEFGRRLNKLLDQMDASSVPADLGSLARVSHQLKELAGVLGILGEDPEKWLTLGPGQIDEAWIEAKIRDRDQARKERDWARADGIRKELGQLGILLEDTPKGTRWRRAD